MVNKKPYLIIPEINDAIMKPEVKHLINEGLTLGMELRRPKGIHRQIPKNAQNIVPSLARFERIIKGHYCP